MPYEMIIIAPAVVIRKLCINTTRVRSFSTFSSMFIWFCKQQLLLAEINYMIYFSHHYFIPYEMVIIPPLLYTLWDDHKKKYEMIIQRVYTNVPETIRPFDIRTRNTDLYDKVRQYKKKNFKINSYLL